MFDYRQCDLSDVDRALCDYAVKLTLDPGAMDAGDVERLRKVGLSDPQITVAAQVISYFNCINRIADGLGVDLEDWMTLDRDSWAREKPDWRKLQSRSRPSRID